MGVIELPYSMISPPKFLTKNEESCFFFLFFGTHVLCFLMLWFVLPGVILVNYFLLPHNNKLDVIIVLLEL